MARVYTDSNVRSIGFRGPTLSWAALENKALFDEPRRPESRVVEMVDQRKTELT